MAVSPKVSIRKIGKTLATLGRRKVKIGDKDYQVETQDCHARDGVSDSETLHSSFVEDPCSFRVDVNDDAPNHHPMSCSTSRFEESVAMPDDPATLWSEACASPRMSSRRILSSDDEAKVSPWSSPSLRRSALSKLDSWLFLSSAHGCTGGPPSDDESESEETTSEQDSDDVVPPLMSIKPAVPKQNKSGFMIDRRMAMQREDSWLNMGVDADDEDRAWVPRSRKSQKLIIREDL